MNVFVIEQWLLKTSYYLICFTTLIADWTGMKSGPFPLEMTFTCLSTANIHYRPFGQLQEGPLPALQIITGSVITTYYDKYGKLLAGQEDQLILDNDEMVWK